MNDSNPQENAEENKEVIEEKDLGEVRHDEPVTVKGIARALLMANEPEQRMEVDHSGNKSDPKDYD